MNENTFQLWLEQEILSLRNTENTLIRLNYPSPNMRLTIKLYSDIYKKYMEINNIPISEEFLKQYLTF